MKDIYSVFTYNISMIIIPRCCSKYSGDFYFSNNSQTLFNDSIIFYCPKCKISYPSSHQLFRNFVLFNKVLSHFNAELDESKKKSIHISVSTPPISYAILDSMVDFNKIFKDQPPTENPDYEEINRKTEIHLNIFAKDAEPKYLENQGLKLGTFSLYCTKCKCFSNYDNSFYNKGIFICQECNNSQKFKKNSLKDLIHFYDGFQRAIDIANKSNLFVIPFSLTGAYMSHIYDDNNIFKAINGLK